MQGAFTKSAGVLSASQQRSGARPAAHGNRLSCNAGLKLDTPKRLWEAGGTEALPFSTPPAYLDGSYPGDRGFDPLRLATIKPGPVAEEKDSLPWMAEAELYNGRVAMAAVAGIVAQEAVGKGPWWTALNNIDLAPGIPNTRQVVPHIWNCTVGQGTCPEDAYGGVQSYVEKGFTLAPGVDKYWAVVAVAHVAFGYLELQRFKNFRSKGETGLAKWAPFDPLNLRSDHMRQAEVRNARLAMLAVLGFAVQANVTGLEPIAALQAHIANPTGNNILTNARGTFTFLVAASLALGGVEVARNAAIKNNAPPPRFEL